MSENVKDPQNTIIMEDKQMLKYYLLCFSRTQARNERLANYTKIQRARGLWEKLYLEVYYSSLTSNFILKKTLTQWASQKDKLPAKAFNCL